MKETVSNDGSRPPRIKPNYSRSTGVYLKRIKGSEICCNLANYKTNHHYSTICGKEPLLEYLKLH